MYVCIWRTGLEEGPDWRVLWEDRTEEEKELDWGRGGGLRSGCMREGFM